MYPLSLLTSKKHERYERISKRRQSAVVEEDNLAIPEEGMLLFFYLC